MTRPFGGSVLLLSFVLSGAAGAQAPSQPAKPAALQPAAQSVTSRPPAPVATPTQTPVQPAEAYTYQPDGRRDPFLNLTVPPDVHELVVSVEDLAQRGGPGYGYRLIARRHPEDFNLTVSSPFVNIPVGGTAVISVITPQGLIVEQAVNDPLSLVKRREIRKLLKTLEDTKG